MSEAVEIEPLAGPLRASIRPPGSKSITNRALVCAALAVGKSTLREALDSEDTRVMIAALRRLGVGVESRDGGRTLTLAGCGGQFPAGNGELDVANSGTTVRFLTAAATLGEGTWRLSGTERMHERPIGDLVEALGQLGADIACERTDDCPPVVVRAAGLEGGRATVRGDVSSQFLSGLLLAAPGARRPVELELAGPLVSRPYVEMTVRVMEAFGVQVDYTGGDFLRVPVATYAARDYEIEPDASAASYFFAAAAICGGEVRVEGLSRESLQGDVELCDVLERMGCGVMWDDDAITVWGETLRGVEADLNAISDTVPTLAAVALFAEGPTLITGVAHVRHKESDRIGDLARELRKLGADVEEREDGLRITPGARHGARIATYDDHRIAMALALVGLRVPAVVIEDPGCTAKTYPEFFEDLERVAGRG